MKNTERKHAQRLPKARFSRIATGAEERNNFYRLTLQLPPRDASDWTNLTPSGVTSPELEKTVDILNAEHLDATMLELVEDLHENPPTSSVEAQSATPDPEPHTEEMFEEEAPSIMEPPPRAISTETVKETEYPPVLLARRATAMPVKSQPAPPTAATKCPRPEFCMQHEEVTKRRRKSKPKPASSLMDIRKYQTEVKPIFPWQPFVRIVHELLYNRGPYKITREAIEALRTVGEGYLLECLEGANLACMHRDRCTVCAKDIRLFRRLRGDADLVGEEIESTEARKADWKKYKEGRLTIEEAMVLDTNRRQKLRTLARRRRQRALQAVRCQ